jgi:putative transcription antitermination factor YqgF
MPNYLAIDFGTSRIGIAVSRASLAEPLLVLPNDQYAIKMIKNICVAENIDKIIIGLSENEMAEKTKKFANRLKSEIDIEMEFSDETLSSQEVREKLKDLKKTKRKGAIDHYAAAEILGHWQETR